MIIGIDLANKEANKKKISTKNKKKVGKDGL